MPSPIRAATSGPSLTVQYFNTYKAAGVQSIMAAATGQPQEWIETGGTSPPSTAPAPAGRRRLLQTSSGRVLVQNKVWGGAGRQAEGLAAVGLPGVMTARHGPTQAPPVQVLQPALLCLHVHNQGVVSAPHAVLPQVHGYEEQLQGVVTRFNASLADGSFQTQLLAYQLRLVPNTGEGWAAGRQQQQHLYSAVDRPQPPPADRPLLQ